MPFSHRELIVGFVLSLVVFAYVTTYVDIGTAIMVFISTVALVGGLQLVVRAKR